MRKKRNSTVKLCAFQNDDGVHCANEVLWYLTRRTGDFMFVCDDHYAWGSRKCGAPLYVEEYNPNLASLLLDGEDDGEL
jgi:hypothetical protein